MAKIKMSKVQSSRTFSKDSTALARGGENTVNRINEKYSKSRIGDMGPAGRKEAMSKVKDYVDTKRPKLVGYKDDNKDYGPKDKKGNYRFAPMEDYKRGGKVKKAGLGIKVKPKNLNERQIGRVDRIESSDPLRARTVANRISARRDARGAETSVKPMAKSIMKSGGKAAKKK
jgi:hypothetical protein